MAKILTGVDYLVYCSNILDVEKHIASTCGGNISVELMETGSLMKNKRGRAVLNNLYSI